MAAGDEDFRTRIVDELQNLYRNEIGAIQNQLAESSIGLAGVSLNTDVELPTLQKAGIEKMDEDERRIRAELENIQNELNNTEHSKLAARRAERQRQDLEVKLADAERRKEAAESMNVDPILHHTEQREVRRKRGGILGGLAWIFKGGKYEMAETEVANPGEKERWERQTNLREEQIKKYTDKIDSLTDELSGLKMGGTNCILIEPPMCRWKDLMLDEIELVGRNLKCIPVIAHLDRFMRLLNDYTLMERVYSRRMLVQYNASFSYILTRQSLP